MRYDWTNIRGEACCWDDKRNPKITDIIQKDGYHLLIFETKSGKTEVELKAFDLVVSA